MSFAGDTLVVTHYHWRAGGVRKVIERALPQVCSQGGIGRVVLVAGEAPPSAWVEFLCSRCPGVRWETAVCEEIGYVSELGRMPDRRVARSFFERVAARFPGALFWVHNPALARNVPMVESLLEALSSGGATALFHHHDFWCDNRWGRWGEAQACGYGAEEELGRIFFSAAPGVLHAGINRADARLLGGVGKGKSAWLPNPFDPGKPASRQEKEKARQWLDALPGIKKTKPLWLLPCRLLRRKNVAEAILRASQGGAVLVTSGEASSSDEKPYAKALLREVEAGGLPAVFADFGAAGTPPFEHLVAAADAVVLTSLLEGFGLAYLDAAFAEKPLICRRLKNVVPDLESFGFRFPEAYEETEIPSGCLDLGEEKRWVGELRERWEKGLPDRARSFLGGFSDGCGAVFSRLTLRGQCEVLRNFRGAGGGGVLQETRWPGGGEELSSEKYAERFWEFLAGAEEGGSGSEETARGVQESFFKERLSSEALYPLLFANET